MSDQAFYVSFPGEISEEDRALLDRPGLQLSAYGVSAAPYQLVKVAAESPEDARRQVVEALGREPEKLQIH